MTASATGDVVTVGTMILPGPQTPGTPRNTATATANMNYGIDCKSCYENGLSLGSAGGGRSKVGDKAGKL